LACRMSEIEMTSPKLSARLAVHFVSSRAGRPWALVVEVGGSTVAHVLDHYPTKAEARRVAERQLKGVTDAP
jgi:hypothetical protein